MVRLPKAVSLVALVVVAPSAIASAWLPPVTAIEVATPLMANVKGRRSRRLSSKLSVALRVPPAVGVNWTVKVVLLPAATEAAGCCVTVKSPELVPLIDTVPSVRAAVPLFAMV